MNFTGELINSFVYAKNLIKNFNEGVIAANDIPVHTVSQSFGLPHPTHDMATPRVVLISSQLNPIDPSMHLSFIVKSIKLASDCYNFNVLLQKSERKLALKAIRTIKCGDEILMWFSDEILNDLQMAFLSPQNIRAQNNYKCHKCDAVYTSPNPLKVHLTLQCAEPTTANVLKLLRKLLSTRKPSRDDAEITVKLENNNYNPLDLSVNITSPGRDKKSSAFKPYKPVKPSRVTFKPTIPYPTVPYHEMNPIFHPPFNPLMFPFPPAQVETMVSNFRSKQGHLCIYCGKAYSRKYGLKIHIRTHTGFKPLKCKYCARPFGDPSNLNKHVRLHVGGETPYKCDLCGKVLVRRRDLERHLKTRHVTVKEEVG